MGEISTTADKALEMLFCLSDGQPVTPQELALKLGVNRTVAMRLISTLHGRGFVSRNGNAYSLGPQTRKLADLVEPWLRKSAEAGISELFAKVGETVVFQIVDGNDVVVLIEMAMSRSLSLQVRHTVGARSPIALTASGLAILAAQPPSMRERVLRAESDKSRLKEKIKQTQQAGFALTSDELQSGVSGMAMPVSLGGQDFASLGILVPTSRAECLLNYRDYLYMAVKEIESAISESAIEEPSE